MRIDDFDYFLPAERIAQHPVEPRHDSRLLVLNRHTRERMHTTFWKIQEFLQPGDVLVINETRVIPAGSRLAVEEGPGLTVEAVLEGARRLIRFNEPIEPFLTRVGQMPLPPYIHEKLMDAERYQTVFARLPGSAAAPTAGLHFTPELMAALEMKGIRFARITLHVGLDTFAPVTESDPREHVIHSEWCELGVESAALINAARRSGKRIVAVGTTSVRTLESAALHAEPDQAVGVFSGATRLYILPGYTFRAVDAMITNFHLPRSTLLMLVSAFAGREEMLATYAEAIDQGYRFYSFGDAMLIV